MTDIKVHKKNCPYCDKLLYSLYEEQLKKNYYMHVRFCKKNPLNAKPDQPKEEEEVGKIKWHGRTWKNYDGKE